MGGRGSGGSRNAEREVNTDITKRQLKNHVSTALKAAGLTKVETRSTAIRGYRSVSHSGFDWGEEYGGVNPPHIIFVGGLRTPAERYDQYLNQVEEVLSKSFKVKRTPNSVEILGEYRKEQ